LLHCWHIPLFFYYNSCAYNCSAFIMWGSKKENLNFFFALVRCSHLPSLLCYNSCACHHFFTPIITWHVLCRVPLYEIIAFFPRKINQKDPLLFFFSPIQLDQSVILNK
jgi:hypothetical protein